MNKPLISSLTLGSALAFGAAAAGADTNPFAATSLPQGYQLASAEHKNSDGKDAEAKCGAEHKHGDAKCGAEHKNSEAKCGEGACGGDMMKTEKTGEASCGGDMKNSEGACGGDAKMGEGKCGEGACGGGA